MDGGDGRAEWFVNRNEIAETPYPPNTRSFNTTESGGETEVGPKGLKAIDRQKRRN